MSDLDEEEEDDRIECEYCGEDDLCPVCLGCLNCGDCFCDEDDEDDALEEEA